MASLSKISIILCLLISSISTFYAQIDAVKKRELITKEFIEAYNKKDYKEMKKKLFLLGKIIVSRNKLKESLSDMRSTLGKLTFVKALHPSETKTEVKVTSERDSSETETFIFNFNKKNKITGFFLKPVDFIYPKDHLNNQRILSTQEKIFKIDSIVKKKNIEANFNGCVLIIDNGNIIYKDCHGYSNLEKRTLLNDSSVFYLASCSKQITATAIMILVEKGKLKFSDTIQKFISDLPYKNITVEHLLTHTSGLPDYISLMNKYWDKTKQASNYDMINTLIKYKPKTYFKPGETFDYSNTGYALLAVIIEKCSGQSFSDFMKQNIFRPAGMQHSSVNGSSSASGDKVTNWAYGYVYSDSLKKYVLPEKLSGYQYTNYLDPIVGDGNINSTITDLALWEKALRENKLIQKTTLDRAYSMRKFKSGEESNYGYGMFISNAPKNESLVYHGGSWPGYHSFILRFIDKNSTIVILSNNEFISFQQLANKIANILLNRKTE